MIPLGCPCCLSQNTVIFQGYGQAPTLPMISRFKVHRHKTGRSHFDLRLIHNGLLRSWSLLKQPPLKTGERRLAIERETRAPADIDHERFTEEAFGEGGVYTWDEGEVLVSGGAGDRI